MAAVHSRSVSRPCAARFRKLSDRSSNKTLLYQFYKSSPRTAIAF